MLQGMESMTVQCERLIGSMKRMAFLKRGKATWIGREHISLAPYRQGAHSVMSDCEYVGSRMPKWISFMDATYIVKNQYKGPVESNL